MHIPNKSIYLPRRTFLRGLGVSIALPFLECMVPLRAAEAATATPRRSAFVYLANGVHSLNYQITTPGKDYEFSRATMLEHWAAGLADAARTVADRKADLLKARRGATTVLDSRKLDRQFHAKPHGDRP